MASRSETDKIHEKICEVTAEYFLTHKKEAFFSLSTQEIYEEVKKYASDAVNYATLKFPGFLQVRKIWISFLSKNHQYTPGERLTVAVLYRLTCIYEYYDYGIIKDILEYNHYHVQMHNGDPIICVIPLLPEKILDIYAKNIIHGNKEAMIRWNFIRNLCKEIKKINPSLILAVIPQVNRMSFMCKTGKINCQIHNLPPIYDSLCIFIKNTPEGQNLIRNFPISHSALERKIKK